MTTVQEALLAHANALRANDVTPEDVAIDLLKQAGLSEEQAVLALAKDEMEKTACAALAAKGIDHLDAVRMVKAANLDISGITTARTTKVNVTADILEKTASHISEMEYRIAELEVELERFAEMEKAAQDEQIAEPLDRLRQSGQFTADDLAALRNMEPELLHKVASTSEHAWGMGGASGKGDGSTNDPFLNWIVA